MLRAIWNSRARVRKRFIALGDSRRCMKCHREFLGTPPLLADRNPRKSGPCLPGRRSTMRDFSGCGCRPSRTIANPVRRGAALVRVGFPHSATRSWRHRANSPNGCIETSGSTSIPFDPRSNPSPTPSGFLSGRVALVPRSPLETCRHPIARKAPAVVPVWGAVCCPGREVIGSALSNTVRPAPWRGGSAQGMPRPVSWLPSLGSAWNAPLSPAASLPSAGVCYRELRGVPGQVLRPLEERTLHCQYSTLTRNRPRAGTVGPAFAVAPGCRKPRMLPASKFPFPASSMVPTRLRTMCFRKPLPRTR